MINRKTISVFFYMLIGAALNATVTPQELFVIVKQKKDLTELKDLLQKAEKEGVDVKKFINMTNQNSQYVKGDPDFSPLHIAVYYDWVSGIAYLIQKGADVNLKTINTGNTPLHLATSKNGLKLLIENGAHINAQNQEGSTPLHNLVFKACLVGFNSELLRLYKDLIIYLLDYGADRFIQNNDEQTPREVALDNRYSEVADLFVPFLDFMHQCRN